MKATKMIHKGLFILAIIAAGLTSCTKDKQIQDPPDSSSLQQLSKDQVAIESASDDALTDANDMLTNNAKILNLCNVTIHPDTLADTVTYTMTFAGTNCAGSRLREGVIKVKKCVTTPWTNVGTEVYLTFIDYKVTKLSTGNWVKLNGTKTWKNISGGKISDLSSSTNPIIHKVQGSLLASFSDGTTRSWNIARQKTFTGTYPTSLVLSVEGIGTSNGYSNLASWGTNRQNELFYTQVNQAVVYKQSCGWDPTSGIVKHQIPADNKSATITYGFDSSNQPVTGTNCPTEFKFDWVKNTHSGTAFITLP